MSENESMLDERLLLEAARSSEESLRALLKISGRSSYLG